MNKNIDLTKLLKQCPKGTKFYSRFLGSVEFCKITSDNYIEITDKNGYCIRFTPNGIYQHSEESAEIDLFPSKDQRDWSKWHRPFVDGDVVMYDDDQFAIFEKYIKYPEDDGLIRYYVYYDEKSDDLDTDGGQAYVQRLATEEEKRKLFDVIKKEGYEWDAEKKELKPLQLFKDGDIVHGNNNCCSYISIYQSDRENNSFNYYASLTTYGGFKINDYADKSNLRLATKEEKKKLFDAIKSHGYNWNDTTKTLEKSIKPKFQDDWMLVPNKSLIEYKIYYNRYTTDEDHHVGFTTLEAMEEALKGMRETNKGFPTYFNIVCKKETVERLDL